MSEALKVRQNKKINRLVVIEAGEDQERYFEVDKDQLVSYLGSSTDGFIDSSEMGDVIDPRELSPEIKQKIKHWFKR